MQVVADSYKVPIVYFTEVNTLIRHLSAKANTAFDPGYYSSHAYLLSASAAKQMWRAGTRKLVMTYCQANEHIVGIQPW